MRFSRLFFIIYFFFTTSFSAFSQIDAFVSTNHLAEKIYVQLDNEMYDNNQTVWFKGLVLNSVNLKPTELSEVLIVEIINSSKEVLQRKLIKLESGVGIGHFDLDEEYLDGTYLIRAFTDWNRNFEDKFIFEKYIKIYSGAPKVDIIEATEINYQSQSSNLIVRYNSDFGDTIDIKNHSLKYSYNNNDNKVIIQKDENGEYFSELLIDEDISNVKLYLIAGPKVLEEKNIKFYDDDFDLQFFPEGGELINGIASRVGFKFLNRYGKGFHGICELLNRKGEVVQMFESNSLGMGSFYFLPNLDENYSVRAKSLKDSIWQVQEFIDIKRLGTVLSVDKSEDIFKVAVQSTDEQDSISIEVISRGYYSLKLKGRLNSGTFYTTLNCNDLPDGVLVFRILSENNIPIAERLVFNEREDQRLKISHQIEDDKKTFYQRDKSEFLFEVQESNGKVTEANLSIKAISVDQLGEIQKSVNNLISYILLDSELKGNIEKHHEYFSKGRVSDYKKLDDLLLTQGWRKYNYSDSRNEIIEILPEKGLEISGVVTGSLAKKSIRKDVDLTMMSFGSETDIQNQKTDSLGRFYFPLGDEFDEKLEVLIQSKRREGRKNSEFNINIDKRVSPEIRFHDDFENEIINPDIKHFLEQNQLRKSIEEAFSLEKDGIELEEVEVLGSRLTPDREKLYQRFGEPYVVIDGDKIRAEEQNWSSNLFSVLKYIFPNDIEIVGGLGGPRPIVKGAGEGNLLVIDGVGLRPREYQFIQGLQPSEVTSVEVIKFAKGFSSFYWSLGFEFPPYGPKDGNIIAIFTKSGKGLAGAFQRVGVSTFSVPVFAMTKEYYTPKYDVRNSESWIKPDLRAIIDWQRSINTTNGKVEFSYYNGDLIGDVRVVIEAISKDGKIGYREFDYEVLEQKSKNQ